MQREKLTRSGPLMEADFYPVFCDGRKMPTRAPKTKPSTAQQQRYNRIMATKKLIRLVNVNFDNTDYWLHPTYSPEHAPQNERQARRDMVNFLRRVRTKRASTARALQKDLQSAEAAAVRSPDNAFLALKVVELGKKIAKLQAPMKYIYVIECQTYKRGIFAGRINWHFHVFLTGGLDRDVIESMWVAGMRVNCDRYQPERFGYETAALYMSKDPQGSKRFCYSRNLDKPSEKSRDGKVTKRTVERMAKEHFEDREYWEKRYKGYRFVRCYSRYNEYNGFWYVSVVMYRTDGEPPKWDIEDWITEDCA